MTMTDGKSLGERLADAVTMFTVSALCLALLVFVAHGTVVRTSEQLAVEKVVAQGGLVQSMMESYVRPGLPLRQFVGFAQVAEPMVKGDHLLETMTTYDREGETIFLAGDRTIRALPPTDERSLQNEIAKLRSSPRYLQVVLPVRNKFERVGDLVLTIDRVKISNHVDALFRPVLYVALIASIGFGLAVFAAWGGETALRRRRVAIAFTSTYLCVAVAIILVMVNVFTEGAQSKGRALADSLGQRLDDIVNFGLQLDQIEGLDEVLHDYRRLNPDLAAAGVTVVGRIVVHTEPALVGRYWATDPANHEYRADLTPPNHPRTASVVLAVPKAIVYWQVLRSVKNFAALFVASSFFAFLFMQVAQAIQQARRAGDGPLGDWRNGAALELVKPIFFLAVFVDHLIYAFLPQFVSEIVSRQELPANYVAVPFMIYYLCFALALMPAGRYELRFGSRPLILSGLALTAASMAMIAFASSFQLLVFARAAAGIGQGMLFIGIQSYVLLKSAREHRTKANTIIVFGFQAGMISGMAIGSLLVGQITPIGVFWLGAMLASMVMLYTFAVLPEGLASGAALPKALSAGEIWREIGWMVRDAKFRRTILLVGIPAKAVLTGVVLFAMPLVLHARGFAQEDIGQITMIYAGCVIFAGTYAARLADETANTRGILIWGALLTAAGLVTIASYGWEPLVATANGKAIATALTIIGVGMIGVAHGFINAPVVTHVTETEVAARCGSTQVGAAYRFLERVGHTLGPIIMGQLFLLVGASHLAFAWTGLAVLVLGCLFLISSRDEKPRTADREEFA